MRVGGSHPPLSSPIWEGCRADCCDVVQETMTRSHLSTATRSTGLPLNCTTLCSAHSPPLLCPSGENHIDKSFRLLLFCFFFCFIFFIFFIFFTSSSSPSTSTSTPPRRDDEFLAVLVISVTTGAEGEARRGEARDGSTQTRRMDPAMRPLVLQYYWRLPESDSVHVACRMGL